MARTRRRVKPLSLMVSSTVYGSEELLDQVYALLTGFGYEVWMSHKGTMPVYPNETALQSCLRAVEHCDLFLSIITPRYGSGIVGDQDSITHQELLRAIESNKPRWILAHGYIVFARSLLRKLGARNPTERAQLLTRLGFADAESLRGLRRREESVFDDFRLIDMYDAAIRHELNEYKLRTGNWVQKFETANDVLVFAEAQFSRYRDVERFLKEQFTGTVQDRASAVGEPPS